ncbi:MULTISPECIES: thiol:disulfide interchange protein DsbA/DsbL [Dyella]|uniref:Thiol:disulfide interchange protein DsbA n=2 Tax=Dyella TaxID=231454 RepID=A0A4V2NKT1_9GAMM|nr:MULTISPECIES: thiol:disulfide interchange protein DsbA/DsbL [Dyella]TBR36253.1 thiol:disulfide interchange protein DsbA/DsbL [Dyella terrae]TCI05910.1 thiol:disulfide interchange protein DsbA/DsbL [Dyella soli]
MLKRLPFLFASLLVLSACGNNSENGGNAAQPTTPAPAATAPAQPAAPATTPAPATASTAAATPAPASTAAAPAAQGPAQPTAEQAAAAQAFVDDGTWVEGKHYVRIDPAQPKMTDTTKIEVIEVFSYGCPSCNNFHPIIDQFAKSLPANTVITYLPVSFMPQENFPMFQRAYLTAQALGVADKANDAMYDAVWNSRELSAYKPNGTGLKGIGNLPTLEDAAKVYAKYGVDPKEFMAVANSFAINTKVKRADELVKSYGVEGTPTLIIDGKYRFDAVSAGGYTKAIDLARWLIAKEAAGK